jgi:hypothetical protein
MMAMVKLMLRPAQCADPVPSRYAKPVTGKTCRGAARSAKVWGLAHHPVRMATPATTTLAVVIAATIAVPAVAAAAVFAGLQAEPAMTRPAAHSH